MNYYLVEGASEPLDVQITVTPAQSSAGLTVALEIVDRRGADLGSPTPTAAWLSQPDWTVRVTGLEALTVAGSPYRCRFSLTLGSVIAFAPTGRYPDTITVVHP